MGSIVSGLFGGGKPKGPSEETLAAQRRSEARIAAKEKREEDEKAARERAMKARQGRSGALTAFSATGNVGVSNTLGG